MNKPIAAGIGGALAALVGAVVLLTGLGDPAAGIGAGGRLRPGTVPAAYEALVIAAGRTCPEITPVVLAAQIDAESSWNPLAVSPAGAQGIAQFMSGTWASNGVDGDGDGIKDPFNPADAIFAQARFMCGLYAAVRDMGGDPLDNAFAAYNAGLGAVQQYGGVPPYPETRGYVARIRALMTLYAAPDQSAPGAGPPGTWNTPTAGSLTSGFGPRWGRLHAGVDSAAPIGTPIYAAQGGTVLAAGPASGYGQWVRLDHGGGITTTYGHVSAYLVQVGQAVQGGQLIALVGNEGHSTGPHLHFQVEVGGSPVDPVAFYAAHGGSLGG